MVNYCVTSLLHYIAFLVHAKIMLITISFLFDVPTSANQHTEIMITPAL